MALETETKDKTMTDFKDWYADQNPDLDPSLDGILIELRWAYEAGAASEAGNMRDEYAGALVVAMESSPALKDERTIARWAYNMADAMLEARKTTGEGE
jgi:hypothetical protein